MKYIDHWRESDWDIWGNKSFASCCSNVLGPITFLWRKRCHCISCIPTVTAQATVASLRQMSKSILIFILVNSILSYFFLSNSTKAPLWTLYVQMSVTESVISREIWFQPHKVKDRKWASWIFFLLNVHEHSFLLYSVSYRFVIPVNIS